MPDTRDEELADLATYSDIVGGLTQTTAEGVAEALEEYPKWSTEAKLVGKSAGIAGVVVAGGVIATMDDAQAQKDEFLKLGISIAVGVVVADLSQMSGLTGWRAIVVGGAAGLATNIMLRDATDSPVSLSWLNGEDDIEIEFMGSGGTGPAITTDLELNTISIHRDASVIPRTLPRIWNLSSLLRETSRRR